MAIVDFDTATWEDTWFESLSPHSKLLFIFLWTNSAKGVVALYEITINSMAFKTGLTAQEVKSALKEVAAKVAWDSHSNIVWVKNHVKRQYLRTGCVSPQVAKGVFKDVSKHDANHQFIKEFYSVYRPSIDSMVKVQGKGGGKGLNYSYSKLFEKFWSVYPKKIGKGKAYESFQATNPDAPLLDVMIAAVASATTGEQWRKDNGRYIPHPATWLNQHRWEDDHVVSLPSSDPEADRDREIAAKMREQITGVSL